jgi:hypothetical protein
MDGRTLQKPSYQKTSLQYDIIRNQLSRPVVYTEDTAQKMKVNLNSVKWEFLFFNPQSLILRL